MPLSSMSLSPHPLCRQKSPQHLSSSPRSWVSGAAVVLVSLPPLRAHLSPRETVKLNQKTGLALARPRVPVPAPAPTPPDHLPIFLLLSLWTEKTKHRLLRTSGSTGGKVRSAAGGEVPQTARWLLSPSCCLDLSPQPPGRSGLSLCPSGACFRAGRMDAVYKVEKVGQRRLAPL